MRLFHGISTDLLRSIYIFCNEPYAPDVTYQKLLEFARKARLQLMQESDVPTTISSPIATLTDNVPTRSNNLDLRIVQTINDLEKNFNERLSLIERQCGNQQCEINAVNRNNNTDNRYYRSYSRGMPPRRTNRNNSSNASNTASQSTNNENVTTTRSDKPIRCFKCNGENYIARYCLSKN